MKIARQKDEEQKIAERLTAYYTEQDKKRKGEVHLSDLTFPRKACWRKIIPKPTLDQEVFFFIRGESVEAASMMLLGTKKGKQKVSKDGLYFSPDVLHPVVTEIKSTRWAPKRLAPELIKGTHHYVKQLTGYMAELGKTLGRLVVFFVRDERDGVVRVYRVTLRQEELQEIQETIRAEKKAFEEAVKTRNPWSLRICPRWLCSSCKYLGECKPWEEDKTRLFLK